MRTVSSVTSPRFSFSAILPIALLVLSSCSLKDRQVSYGVSLQLSPSAQQRLSKSVASSGSRIAGGAGIAGVSGSLDGATFQCFALNVIGDGIASKSRFGCTNPDQFLGAMGGMAPLAGGKVDVMVPAGASRKVQLLGFQSTIGCPSFADLIAQIDASGGSKGPEGIGEVYLLGESVVDVFGDTIVNINAQFDPTKKYFAGCDGAGGGGQKELSFQLINDSPAIEAGVCAPLPVNAHVDSSYSDPIPGFVPTVTSQSAAGNVRFYFDESCSSQYDPTSGSVLLFDSGLRHHPLYVKADAAVLSFKVKPVVSDPAWTARESAITLVDRRIELSASPSPVPIVGDCRPIYLSQFQGNAASEFPTATDFLITIHHNTSSGQQYSQAKLYTDSAACWNTGDTGLPGSDGDHVRVFKVNFASTPALFVRLDRPEEISIGMSSISPTHQPSMVHLMYAPFHAYVSTNRVGLDGGNELISIGHGGDPSRILDVRVGGKAVSNLSIGSPIEFTAPAMPAGSYPIDLDYKLDDGSIFVMHVGMLEYLPFATGTGTTGNPFPIHTAAELARIGDFGYHEYALADHIDVSSLPKKAGDFLIDQFNGKLRGNLNGISYHLLYLNAPLIRNCNLGSSIESLTVKEINLSVTQSIYAGAICGELDGRLADITISPATGGKITSSVANHRLGGAVGRLLANGFVDLVQSTVPVQGQTGIAGYVGGIVGINEGGQVYHGFMHSGTISSALLGGNVVGGVVGVQASGTVQYSFSKASVSGAQIAGGLVGRIESGWIRESFTLGNVSNSGAGAAAGGLAGLIGGAATVQESYAKASISSPTAGGFAGVAQSGGSVANSYSVSSTVSGTTKGGFIAQNGGVTVSNITYYASGAISTDASSATVTTVPDDWSQYPGIYNSANWRRRTDFPAGATADSPVLRWACPQASGSDVFSVAAGQSCLP